ITKHNVVSCIWQGATFNSELVSWTFSPQVKSRISSFKKRRDVTFVEIGLHRCPHVSVEKGQKYPRRVRNNRTKSRINDKQGNNNGEGKIKFVGNRAYVGKKIFDGMRIRNSLRTEVKTGWMTIPM
ncbi:hypothetical protein V1478_000429, partial [Vespula squamosa]